MSDTLPGVHIPDEVIMTLPSRDGGLEVARAVGRQLARDLLHHIKAESMFPGAYLIAPNRDPWEALKTLNGD